METNFAGLFLLWISSEFEILLHIQYLKWPPLLIMLFNMVILIALLFKNCSIVWNLIWCEWTLGGSQESVWFLYLSEIQDDRHHWTQSVHEGSMNHPLAYKGGIFYDDSRVFNKIVLNRLNWNLKRLHDKMGGVWPPWKMFSITFKIVHSEAFLR